MCQIKSVTLSRNLYSGLCVNYYVVFNECLINMNTIISHNKKEEGSSWLVSLIFHSLLLVYLFFATTSSKLEKVESEGILVVLGEFDAGVEDQVSEGDISPSESNTSSSQPTSTEKNNDDNEITVEEAEVAVKKSDVKKAETKKTTTPPKTEPKSTAKTSTNTDNSKNNDDQLNKKKSQFGDLFGKGKGSGGEQGNQGETKGDPNGKVLTGISTGTGRVGGGLSNRGIVQAPTLSENSQKYGKVVVKVCVDKNGKVIESTFTQKGSTTTDSQLVGISEKAAKKYVFAPGSLDQQCGTITFDFKLN